MLLQVEGRSGRFYSFFRIPRDFGQAEVENFSNPAVGDEDVGRLDVAMNDAFGVGGVECVGDLDGQRQQRFQRHRMPRNAVLQRHTVEKLHGDEGLPVLLADVMNSPDVGMIQRRRSLRFPLKAGQRMWVLCEVGRQELESDETVQADVLGLVDDTHAATAELLDDAIVRDGLADHEYRRNSGWPYVRVL